MNTAITSNWGTLKMSRPHLASKGHGIHRPGEDIPALVRRYSARLRHVRITTGDWRRVLGLWITQEWSHVGIFLDPPYTKSRRINGIYASDADSSSDTVAHDMVTWAREHAAIPGYRIVVCGLPGEHGEWPEGWSERQWIRQGGYANMRTTSERKDQTEHLWLSPQCLRADDTRQLAMFSEF